MKRLLSFVLVLVLISNAVPMSTPAQAHDSHASRYAPAHAATGYHEVTLRMGFLGDIDYEVSGLGIETGLSGGLVTVQYDYWIRDEWAVGLAAGMINGGLDFSSGRRSISASAATVGMVHVVATYGPAGLSSPHLRPFVSLGVGPYIGSFSGFRVDNLRAGAETSTTPGLRALAGVDIRVARRFKVGFAGGYHWVGSFGDAIGAAMDYSGPEFSMGFGLGFGGY